MGSRRDWARVLLVAGAVTLLLATKPLYMDDSSYHHFAEQIAAHPLDPYGFEESWLQWPQPANEVLAPPVFLYAWGFAIRFLGSSPFVWKLATFPFQLALAGSLSFLLRRFAPRFAGTLLVFLVASPFLLPSANMMLDVPALSLELLAIALFLTACDRGRASLALLAGLVAGLAIETKYTGFAAPAVVLAAAFLARKRGLGLLAAGTAGLVFVLVEAAIASKYGESHFLANLRLSPPAGPLTRLALLGPLVALAGGVGPGIGLLGLVALGARGRGAAVAATAVAFGFALVATVPGSSPFLNPDARWLETSERVRDVVFGVLGAGTWAAVIGCALVSRRERRDEALFLVAWLAIEIAASLALSPFPAVRRLLGVLVAATFVCGRAASERAAPRGLVRAVAALGIALGLAFFTVDSFEAFSEKRLAESTAQRIRARDSGARIFFLAHWGFEFHAERSGMIPLVPDRSQLRRGDWLVLPDPLFKPVVELDHFESAFTLLWDDALPVRTRPAYYLGATPLERKAGPRLAVRVFRCTADTVPSSPPPLRPR
jgi:hypothetical protein